MKKSIRISVLICFILTFIFSIININKALASEDIFKLDNISISNKSDDVEAIIDSFDKTNVKTNITYHKINDYVIYKLTIKNNDSKDYTIKSIVDNNTNNNILYEYDSYENEIISSNSTKDIYIKTIYKNKLTDISERDSSNEVKLVFSFVDSKGNDVEKDIIVNPKTYDYIGIYITFAIVSIAAIILLIVVKKKNKKKILLMLISILFIPMITRALTDSYTITFDNTNKIYDRLVVTYDDNEEVVDYNTKLNRPNVPTKEGYEFLGWYMGDSEYDFDSLVKEDMKLKSKWRPIEYTISYEDSNADNPDKYTIEDEITLNNPTKAGYSFSGWTGSNGDIYQTRVTISHETGNKSYKANFSPNTDTSYKVIHRYPNLDGTYEEVVENLTGTTDTEVRPSLILREGFDGPRLQTITISAEELKIVTYTYTRKNYRLILNSDIETTFTDLTYPYETEITLTAKDKDNYEFTKWSNGETTKTIKFNITKDTEIYPEYVQKKYKVTYNANGGNFYNIAMLTNEVTYTLNEINNKYETDDTYRKPTKTDHVFKGWYKDSECTDGNEFDIDTVVLDDDIEVYAKWQEGIAMFMAGPILGNEGMPGRGIINSNSISFSRSVTIPKEILNDTYLVSTNDSEIPIYMWYEEDTRATKWYSDVTNVYLNPNSSSLFANLYYINDFDLSGLDTSYVTDMSRMFSGFGFYNPNLETIDLSHFDTSNVTNMTAMFFGTKNLKRLDVSNFDTSNVESMVSMFKGAELIETLDVSNFNTSSVKDMSVMFSAMGSLKSIDLSGFDMTNVTKLSGMFIFEVINNNYSIKSSSLEKIILPNDFGKNVSNMTYVFNNLNSLKDVNVQNINVSNSTNLSAMFSGCSSLTELDLSNFDTRNVTNIGGMFSGCNNLSKIIVSDKFVTTSVTNSTNMFKDCTSLIGGKGTVYDANHIDKEYAHIDGGTSNPGYFTSNLAEYTVSFDTDDGSAIEEQVVYDGEKATRPTINPTKEGYQFVNWYTDSSYDVLFNFDTPIVENTIVYAKFKEEPFPTVFSESGECTFNGKSGVITGSNCSYANGINKYIDTGINLYNEANHDKDYEIGFTIVRYNPAEQEKQATFMNTKYEADNYPGIVFRRYLETDQLDLSSRRIKNSNQQVVFSNIMDNIKIYRIYNQELDVQEIFYSINGNKKVKVNDLSQYNPVFDLSVWFGASPTDATALKTQRVLKGTLSNMYIKLGKYQE